MPRPLPFGRGTRNESASLRLIREVLTNLTIVGKDGDHLVLVVHVATKPVVGNVDYIIVLVVVHKVEEQVFVVLVGICPETSFDENKALVMPFFIFVDRR